MASEVVLLSLHISISPCIKSLVSLAAEVQILPPATIGSFQRLMRCRFCGIAGATQAMMLDESGVV